MIVLGGEPSVTDWMTAIAAGLTFFVALVALIFAWGQIKEAEKTRKQVQEIEREKAQPMVVAFMENSSAVDIVQELVIRNFGQTPAYEVRFISDPPLTRTGSPNPSKIEEVPIPEVIPFLAPGQEWRTIWDVGHERNGIEELTDVHEVSISFQGIDGVGLESKSILDWKILKARHYVETYRIHDMAKATKNIAALLKKATETSGGIKVWTRSGEAKDQRAQEQARQWREQRAKAAENVASEDSFTNDQEVQEQS